VHVCTFRTVGFPFLDTDTTLWALPCGVAYHGNCVRAGPPFHTRLENNKGLILPSVKRPHFICESCTVRAELKRELRRTDPDIHLLMFERMRMIDSLNWWQLKTLKQYGPHFRYLEGFGKFYGVGTLVASPLTRPPVTPAIPIIWSLLNYSLRVNKEGDRIKNNTVRAIKSAASVFYAIDLQNAFPRQVLRDSQRRGQVMTRVSPTDEMGTTFCSKGMARRMGTETKPSWAVSHVHVAYIDKQLDAAYKATTNEEDLHELACAGSVNLMAYLGWLRSGELFGADRIDFTLTQPDNVPTRGIPLGVGAVELNLAAETKSDPCQTADVIMAWETLSGLSVGKWLERLFLFPPQDGCSLFSTQTQPSWDSKYFREQCAWPLLEEMRRGGEPSLKCFSTRVGGRIRDKLYSLHSWRRAGRSRVSRPPRHNEPNPPGTREASGYEVYEHGRWRRQGASEDMPAHYNQWALPDRLAVTLLCM
jgi:hypothetical protein